MEGIRVVGAGLGRTGTNSLKLALEELLKGPCHHMFEAMQMRDRWPEWDRAIRGEPVSWSALMKGYVATVDWPACAWWSEISAAYPDAMILLSVRDPESWWASMQQTIIPLLDQSPDQGEEEWTRALAMVRDMFSATLTPNWHDRDAFVEAYERHNEQVRRIVPADRLIEWRTGEGWEPICRGLGLAVPEIPFPHENASGDFRSNVEEHWNAG